MSIKVESNCSESNSTHSTLILTASVLATFASFLGSIFNLFGIIAFRAVHIDTMNTRNNHLIIVCNFVQELAALIDSLILAVTFSDTYMELSIAYLTAYLHVIAVAISHAGHGISLLLATLLSATNAYHLKHPYWVVNECQMFGILAFLVFVLVIPSSYCKGTLQVAVYCNGQFSLKERMEHDIRSYIAGIEGLISNIGVSSLLLYSTVSMKKTLKALHERAAIGPDNRDLSSDKSLKRFYNHITNLNLTFVFSNAVNLLNAFCCLSKLHFSFRLTTLFFCITALCNAIYASVFVLVYYHADRKFHAAMTNTIISTKNVFLCRNPKKLVRKISTIFTPNRKQNILPKLKRASTTGNEKVSSFYEGSKEGD